jgi:hypothetical protein
MQRSNKCSTFRVGDVTGNDGIGGLGIGQRTARNIQLEVRLEARNFKDVAFFQDFRSQHIKRDKISE